MGLPENIKRLREMHGLSQAELGKIAGVSDKAVSTWENGLKQPRMGALQKMADAFGLQKSNLIEEGGLDAAPQPAAPADALMAFYGEVKDRLDDDDKADLMAFMRVKAQLKDRPREK